VACLLRASVLVDCSCPSLLLGHATTHTSCSPLSRTHTCLSCNTLFRLRGLHAILIRWTYRMQRECCLMCTHLTTQLIFALEHCAALCHHAPMAWTASCTTLRADAERARAVSNTDDPTPTTPSLSAMPTATVLAVPTPTTELGWAPLKGVDVLREKK
jgi:hypothetical protein